MSSSVPSINAMGFYHSDGFVPAWKQAMQFAGEDGRIGTMSDVAEARIACSERSFPWNTYFTTTTAEYFGYSKGGVRILIVAHGVGPMSSLEGIQKAYSYEYKASMRRSGGRITQSEFLQLEAGAYGEVSVVEFDPILERYECPFLEYLTASEALNEPLALARLGPNAEAYIEHHAEFARKFHEEEHDRDIPDPFLFELGEANNCRYSAGGFGGKPLTYPHLDKGDGAVAHLLSTGSLMRASHNSKYRVSSLANEINCHSWWHGTRLLGIRGNDPISAVHPGFGNINELILGNWMRLLEPVTGSVEPHKLYPLIQSGNVMFTQYPKQGASMDTGEPEHLVTSAERIGGPVEFITETVGYHGFFKYDIRDMQKLMPAGANAYRLIGDPECVMTDGNPTHQRSKVQFYRVTVDTSRRLVQSSQLKNDYDRLMELFPTQRAA